MTQAAALDFDHVELLIGAVENAADANAKAVRNTVLSPRFTPPISMPWTS